MLWNPFCSGFSYRFRKQNQWKAIFPIHISTVRELHGWVDKFEKRQSRLIVRKFAGRRVQSVIFQKWTPRKRYTKRAWGCQGRAEAQEVAPLEQLEKENNGLRILSVRDFHLILSLHIFETKQHQCILLTNSKIRTTIFALSKFPNLEKIKQKVNIYRGKYH